MTDGCVTMSHKRSGLCGQIVAGGLADAVPMSLLPQKRIVLGGHGGSEKMRDRSRRELDGYAGADADSAFAAAIVGLHRHSALCRVVHGLVGDADYLSCLDDDEAAGLCSAKPVTLPGRLYCQPLPDRAADLIPAQPRILGSMMTAPMGQESAPACDG